LLVAAGPFFAITPTIEFTKVLLPQLEWPANAISGKRWANTGQFVEAEATCTAKPPKVRGMRGGEREREVGGRERGRDERKTKTSMEE
jgi:hypothetical protein